MPSITFITPSNERVEVEAQVGDNLMEVAVAAAVEGIDADCGGSCSCATCHVHVDPQLRETLEEPEFIEAGILEFEKSANDYSRLSCQLTVSEAMDGLTVQVADR